MLKHTAKKCSPCVCVCYKQDNLHKKYTSKKWKKKNLTSCVRSCWPGHCESPTGQEFPPHDIITNVYISRVSCCGEWACPAAAAAAAVIKSSSQHTHNLSSRALAGCGAGARHTLAPCFALSGGQRAIPIHSVHLLFNLFCCNPLSVGGTNERKMTSLLSNQRRTAAMNLRAFVVCV